MAQLLAWLGNPAIVGTAWAAAAAAGVLTTEVVYRKANGDFPLIVIPLLLINQPLLWKMYNGGPSLLIAVATFGFFTAIGRIGLSIFVLHEPVQKGNLVAAILLLTAVAAGRLWR